MDTKIAEAQKYLKSNGIDLQQLIDAAKASSEHDKSEYDTTTESAKNTVGPNQTGTIITNPERDSIHRLMISMWITATR